MRGYPDYEGGKSRLFTVAEWAALEGTDKTFSKYDIFTGFGTSTTKVYTVSPATVLYIMQYTAVLIAAAAANADLPQHFMFTIEDVTGGEYWVHDGGDGGVRLAMSKPIVFPAGHQMRIILESDSNHACSGGFTVFGYEI